MIASETAQYSFTVGYFLREWWITNSHIDKIYTVLGLSIEDGAVMYNSSYSEFLQLNRNDIKSHRYMLEESPKSPIPKIEDIKMLEGKNMTSEEYIRRITDMEALNKHIKLLEKLQTVDTIIAWIFENATTIAVINIVLVIFILVVIVKCK